MEGILYRKFLSKFKVKSERVSVVENLSQGRTDTEYKITDIKSHDEELENFLFSLGCYEGEEVTLISILGETYIINVKEARYCIDKKLAAAIKVEAV